MCPGQRLSQSTGVISEATPEQLPAVAALCGRAFGQPPAEHFAAMMEHDPRASEAVTLVCSVEGQLAATARIFARAVRWRGGALRVGGIGNVATDPAHRGQGHALALMRRAVEVMEARGFALSLLFTDIPALYEKVGYALFRQPWWRVNPSQISAVAPRGVAVRDAVAERDLSQLMALQASFNEGRDGTMIRSAADWAAMRRIYPADDALALVAERAGQLVAHVRVMRRPGVVRLHELSAADPEAAVAILAAAARRCAEIDPAALLLTLPDWPLIREAISVVFRDWTMTREPAGMWRALAGGPSQEEVMRRAEAGELYFWAGDRF